MHLYTRNVNTAFRELVTLFYNSGYPEAREDVRVRRRASRNGDVLVVDEPVLITYSHPTERVLLNRARDWPCFLGIYEALYMLAGRNDVAPLAYYCKRMEEFSDDGTTLNGSYGYRWRASRHGDWPEKLACGQWGGVDQLDLLVSHLKAYPDSRRAVLSMWNVEDDLLNIGGGLRCKNCGKTAPEDSAGTWCPCNGGWERSSGFRDVCCNLSILFSLRPGTETDRTPACLDMTVTNRSNDLLWGCLGTNYCTFTILQEYVAARLGATTGLYHHFSNNLHVYVDRPDWKPKELLGSYLGGEWPVCRDGLYGQGGLYGPGGEAPRHRIPVVSDPGVFERELPLFVERFSGKDCTAGGYDEPFLSGVAQPLMLAHRRYKLKEYAGALLAADSCKADDWRVAATAWLERRIGKSGAHAAAGG